MELALIGALIVGVTLGLLGSGGSILTVPILIYLLGEHEKVAIAESLGIVGVIAFVGSIPFIAKKQFHWPSFFLFGIPGMLGTYGGAWLAEYISSHVQMIIFSVVMLLAAMMMLRKTTLIHKTQTKQPLNLIQALKIGSEGAVVGVLTGLVGVGGGFLIVPALVLLGGLPIHLAIGTSVGIIAMKSAAGFYKYTDVLETLNLSVNWELVGIFSLVGIAGSFVGKYLSTRIPNQKLKQIFAWFLLVMGIFMIVQQFL